MKVFKRGRLLIQISSTIKVIYFQNMLSYETIALLICKEIKNLITPHYRDVLRLYD